MSFSCFPAAKIGKCDKVLSHNISTKFTLFFSGFVLHCCCLTSQTPAHDSFSNTLAGHSTQQEATALLVCNRRVVHSQLRRKCFDQQGTKKESLSGAKYN